MDAESCLESLRNTLIILAPGGRLGIAYSGGLDSRFLAHAAALSGFDPLLLHASGPHIAPSESVWARDWAARRGLRFVEIPANPLERSEVAENSPERCYACKHYLFSKAMEALHAAWGDFGPLPLCDGSNLSDHGGYRPGLKAVRELGVHSPLALAGFDKGRIRRAGRLTGLEWPDQQARPCMLTRLAYGLPPTAGLLACLAEAEERIAGLLAADLGRAGAGESSIDFRLRVPEAGSAVLHLTVEPGASLRASLAEAVVGCGLPCPAIVRVDDLSGYFDRLRASDAGPESA